jgi:signal transduction histidine kinase
MKPLNGIIDGANILINQAHELSDESANKASSEISTASYSLIRNTQKLMIYSKLQLNGGFDYPEHNIPNLSIILDDVIKKLKLVFHNNQIDFKPSIEEILNVKGNFEVIKYLFDEIIGNAFKYGTGAIRVSLTKDHKGSILFEVSNRCNIIKKFTTSDIKPYKKFHDENDNSLGIGLVNCIRICNLYDYEFNVLCESNIMYVGVEILSKSLKN